MQESLLAALRRTSRPLHDRLESTLSLDGPLDLHRYTEVLRGFHSYLAVWEPAVGAALPASLHAWFEARRRGPRAARDLAVLGAHPADAPARLRLPLDTESHAMGALYVMEGSVLGGQVIARRVRDDLGLDETNGAAYFAGRGARTGAMWREFLELLARHDEAGGNHAAACSAAAATFESLSHHFAKAVHAA